MIKTLLSAAAATALALSPAIAVAEQAQQADKTKQVVKKGAKRVAIPFVATNGIYSWKTGPDNSLLLEAHHNDWYKATFSGYCPPLKYEISIGIIANPMGDFDRFSKVIVDDRICFVDTLEHLGKLPESRNTAE